MALTIKCAKRSEAVGFYITGIFRTNARNRCPQCPGIPKQGEILHKTIRSWMAKSVIVLGFAGGTDSCIDWECDPCVSLLLFVLKKLPLVPIWWVLIILAEFWFMLTPTRFAQRTPIKVEITSQKKCLVSDSYKALFTLCKDMLQLFTLCNNMVKMQTGAKNRSQGNIRAFVQRYVSNLCKAIVKVTFFCVRLSISCRKRQDMLPFDQRHFMLPQSADP